MLTKELCVKCKNETDEPWELADDLIWEHGCVDCPRRYSKMRWEQANTEFRAPEYCPYRLEQVLREEDVEQETVPEVH